MVRANILIVEDEQTTALNIQLALQRYGYIPAIVSSLQEARARTERVRPDLALVDPALEESEAGVQAASQLFSQFDIPVILLMPYGDDRALEQAVARARATDPDGFLLRPYAEGDLVRTVETVLREHAIARKRAHFAEQLCAVVEDIPDFVATTDVEGNVLYMNPAGRRLVGVSENEGLFNTHIAHTHPAWAIPVVLGVGVETALLDGTWRGEAALINRDGKEIPVSETITAHRDADGKCKFLSIVAHDISGLKETEQRARESEQFYRSIVETANVGIWIVDPDDRVVFANPTLARWLGYAVEEMVGQPLDTFVEAQDRTATAANVEAPQHGVKSQRVYKLRRKEGAELGVTLSTSPLYDREERYTGVLGMVTEQYDPGD